MMDGGDECVWKGDVMDIPTVHAQHLSSASLVVAVKDWDRCSCGKVNIKTCPTHPQCTCHDLIGEAVLPLNDLLKRKRSAIKKTVRLTRPGHKPRGECEFVVGRIESNRMESNGIGLNRTELNHPHSSLNRVTNALGRVQFTHALIVVTSNSPLALPVPFLSPPPSPGRPGRWHPPRPPPPSLPLSQIYCQESVNTDLELWKKEVQRRGGGALNQRARPSTLALPGSEPPSQSNTSARKAPKGLATVGEGGGGGEDVAQLKAELTELKFAFFNHAVGESYLVYRYQVYIYSIVLV